MHIINVMKTICVETTNGQLHIFKADDGDSYVVEYHNPIYKNSPFRLSNSFSTSFTMEQIEKSSEVVKFLNRFN